MGLLGQAMAGFVSGAAGAGANLIHEDMKNDALKEREQAAAVRAENLQRLKQVHEDGRADKKMIFEADREDKRSKDKTAAEEARAGRDPSGIQDEYGNELSKAEFAERSKRNKDAIAADRLAKNRGEDKQMEGAIVDNMAPTARQEMDNALGNKKPRSLLDSADPIYTEEERNLSESRTRLLSSKAVEKEKERKEKAQSKYEEDRRRQEDRQDNIKLAASLRPGSGSKAEEKKLSADEKRVRQLDDIEAKNGQLSERQETERSSLVKKLGGEYSSPDKGPSPEALSKAKKEASEKAGYLSTDKTDFAEDGGSRKAFIERRAREIDSGGKTEASKAPAASTGLTAKSSGNTVKYGGKTYPKNSDGTVTIDGKKYRVKGE